MFTFSRGFTLFITLLSSLLLTARSCQFHGYGLNLSNIDFRSMIADNVASRSLRHRELSSTRITLHNVRVFDGSVILSPSTVVIDRGFIGRPCTACEACPHTESYDAQGMTLLPGLIDSYAHPANISSLVNMTRFGITTAVNAFCPVPEFCASLTNHTGLASLIMASFFATSPGSEHANIVGPSFDNLLINNTTEVPSFVARQIAQGADFIKVIGSAPLPGLSQDEQIGLVIASHKGGKQVMLHTSSYASYEQGLIAGVDQIHHSTLDVPIDNRLLKIFKARDIIVCPTLIMMRAIVQQDPSMNGSFSSAAETVMRLHKARVPIIAGTDANMQPTMPAMVMYGSSLHDELENLVAAGLTPVEALNAATVLPAKYFQLIDRGSIKEGMRADLLLVDGDPTTDITATRKIVKVWVGGIEFDV